MADNDTLINTTHERLQQLRNTLREKRERANNLQRDWQAKSSPDESTSKRIHPDLRRVLNDARIEIRARYAEATEPEGPGHGLPLQIKTHSPDFT